MLHRTMLYPSGFYAWIPARPWILSHKQQQEINNTFPRQYICSKPFFSFSGRKWPRMYSFQMGTPTGSASGRKMSHPSHKHNASSKKKKARLPSSLVGTLSLWILWHLLSMKNKKQHPTAPKKVKWQLAKLFLLCWLSLDFHCGPQAVWPLPKAWNASPNPPPASVHQNTPKNEGYERCVCLVCSGKFCGIAMYCIHVSLQVDIIYALFPRQLSVLSFSAILVSDVWTAYVRIHHVLDSRVLLSCQCWHHLCPLCWQILWTARIDVHVAVGNPSRPAWPTWLDSWSPLSLDSPEG